MRIPGFVLPSIQISLLLLASCTHAPHIRAKNGVEFDADVQITGTQELCLVGDAAAEPWISELPSKNLKPWSPGLPDQIEISLCGMNSHFRGISFSEWVLSLGVQERSRTDAPPELALIQAWNSRVLFAWVERSRNLSPYEAGDITLAFPNSFSLTTEQKVQVRAFHPQSQPGENLGHTEFAGHVYLPPQDGQNRSFLAYLAGEQRRIPFSPPQDQLLISFPPETETPPSREVLILKKLQSSGFKPRVWLFRPNATHARGPTQETP